jgi:hypothetical protein
MSYSRPASGTNKSLVIVLNLQEGPSIATVNSTLLLWLLSLSHFFFLALQAIIFPGVSKIPQNQTLGNDQPDDILIAWLFILLAPTFVLEDSAKVARCSVFPVWCHWK